jgi:hypothetical protein
MGMLAAQTVLQQIRTPASAIHTRLIVVDPEFVVRESTCLGAAAGRRKRDDLRRGRRAPELTP